MNTQAKEDTRLLFEVYLPTPIQRTARRMDAYYIVILHEHKHFPHISDREFYYFQSCVAAYNFMKLHEPIFVAVFHWRSTTMPPQAINYGWVNVTDALDFRS